MYFGYLQMWRYTFVPVGFAIVMATFVALALVYAVGSARGGRAARRYVTIVSLAFLAASALDLLWGLMSGHLGGFIGAYGLGPLIEMAVLAALCIGSMWFMASAYVAGKMRE